MNMYQLAPFFVAFLVTLTDASEKTVTTSSDLQSALDSAQPGDIINLASGTYNGPFTISTSGTKSSPIFLHTDAQHLKITGSGVGFTILGDHWTVKYLPISDFDTGVLLKGTGIVLEALAVTDVKTGVDVQGQGNTIQNCAIEATRVGIHVGADNTVLESNSVRGSDPAIVADSGTCCGRFEWNVASGKMKVEGTNYRSDGNVMMERGDAGKPGAKDPPHSFLSSITSFLHSIFG